MEFLASKFAGRRWNCRRVASRWSVVLVAACLVAASGTAAARAPSVLVAAEDNDRTSPAIQRLTGAIGQALLRRGHLVQDEAAKARDTGLRLRPRRSRAEILEATVVYQPPPELLLFRVASRGVDGAGVRVQVELTLLDQLSGGIVDIGMLVSSVPCPARDALCQAEAVAAPLAETAERLLAAHPLPD